MADIFSEELYKINTKEALKNFSLKYLKFQIYYG